MPERVAVTGSGTCVAVAQSTVLDAQECLSGALNLGNGEKPFPWQCELLRRFLGGENVSSIDIPTGLGKTAVMVVWLVARALGASLPRRLVYVVDRRAVVDQATKVAESLCTWVAKERRVADALGLGDRALPISTLRGQHVDNRAWLDDPSSPAIVVGTVDMVGSRLLFSGYGVSPKMRPYHAGLLGADTLVVLDEAHLVPAFEGLLRQVERKAHSFGPNDPSLRALVPQFKLLSLSATGGQGDATTLILSDDDRSNPIVMKRLTAKKTLSIVDLANVAEATATPADGKSADDADEATKKNKSSRLAAALAKKAWELTTLGSAHARCVVFCNARKDATTIATELPKLAKSAGAKEPTIELLVGARRVRERTKVATWLVDHGFVEQEDGTGAEPQGPTFLVATSAGEVGVDMDADHMVCDLVAWERMVQRLGRVNRRGDGDASVVVVVDREPAPSDSTTKALKKSETSNIAFKDADAKIVAHHKAAVAQHRALRTLLDAVAKDGGGSLSPAALQELRARQDLGNSLRDATTVEPLRPELTRPLVDAWSMTSLDEHPGRPEVDPWLRGFRPNDPPQTTVVWRRHLPVRADGSFDAKAAKRFFEAAPPHTSEGLETETYRVLDWLIQRAAAVGGAENEKLLEKEQVVAIALGARGELRGWCLLKELATAKSKDKNESKEAKKERERDLKELEQLLIGATLVVDARLGGLADGLLNEESGAIAEAADDSSTMWLKRPDAKDVPVTGFRIRVLRDNEADESAWRATLEAGWVRRHLFVTNMSDGEPSAALVIDGWAGDAATEEERAEADRPQLLDMHQRCAEDCARQIAQRLGVESAYANLLALAARLHDEGKRAARWQRAFKAPIDGCHYAKTKGPIDFDLLDGYRHELGSLPYVENDSNFKALATDDQDFILHLVAAHHGFARPVIGTSGCDYAPPSMVEERARAAALRFARLLRRWGPWGLAWWESLLRAADQTASRRNQQEARAQKERQ